MFNERTLLKYLIIFGVFVLIPFGVYQLTSLQRLAKSDYIVFNSNKLDGKIRSVSISSGLSFFKLDNEDVRYSFSPLAVESNKDKNFSSIATIGDSIFKKPFSDTLVLTHKGQMYYYTFSKY